MTPKKILIIDDEPFTCQLIAKVLQLNGYDAIILTDSQTLLETVKVEQPALILLDYHLGTNYGLDLLQILRGDPLSSQIPVIITSGIDREDEVLAAGAQAFLLKPFDWQELTSIIDTMLVQKHQQ